MIIINKGYNMIKKIFLSFALLMNTQVYANSIDKLFDIKLGSQVDETQKNFIKNEKNSAIAHYTGIDNFLITVSYTPITNKIHSIIAYKQFNNGCKNEAALMAEKMTHDYGIFNKIKDEKNNIIFSSKTGEKMVFIECSEMDKKKLIISLIDFELYRMAKKENKELGSQIGMEGNKNIDQFFDIKLGSEADETKNNFIKNDQERGMLYYANNYAIPYGVAAFYTPKTNTVYTILSREPSNNECLNEAALTAGKLSTKDNMFNKVRDENNNIMFVNVQGSKSMTIGCPDNKTNDLIIMLIDYELYDLFLKENEELGYPIKIEKLNFKKD